MPDEGMLMKFMDEQARNTNSKIDSLAQDFKEFKEDHETRMRAMETMVTRIVAYGAVLLATVTAGFPFLKTLLHIGGP